MPPSRYTPPPPQHHEPRRRELGTDPTLEGPPRKTWLPWLLGGIGAAVVIGLVITFIVVSFSAPNVTQADPTTQPDPVTEPSANPDSSFGTAQPQEPAQGARIPITTDVSFPDGMTFVPPNPGDWFSSTSERQPDAVIMEDPKTGSYIQVLETAQQPSTYRDEDLTRSFLNTAEQGFTGNPSNVGDPTSWYVSGAGYELELLVQRVEWDYDDTVAFVASRFMPNTGSTIQIYVIAEAQYVDDPNSPLWNKLNELSFTVP